MTSTRAIAKPAKPLQLWRAAAPPFSAMLLLLAGKPVSSFVRDAVINAIRAGLPDDQVEPSRGSRGRQADSRG